MPADGFTLTTEPAYGLQVELTGSDARTFIRIMTYGRELEQAKAGVRLALGRVRHAQHLQRNGWLASYCLSPAKAREGVRREIARARQVEAKIAGRA